MPESETKLVNASVLDARELAGMHIQAWLECYRGIMPDTMLDNLDIESRARMWRRLLADAQSDVLLLRDRGKLVGFVDFGPCRDVDRIDGDTGELRAIYVLKDWQGQGHGGRMIRECHRELARRGYNRSSLWVLRDNKPAVDFYQRYGYRHDGASKEVMELPHIRMIAELGRRDTP